MIYQEKLFTKEECDKIISYQNVYLDLIYRSAEPSIDLENRRIDNVGIILKGKKLGKFFNVWDIVNNSESEWMFEKLFNCNIKLLYVCSSNVIFISCLESDINVVSNTSTACASFANSSLKFSITFPILCILFQ